MKVKVRKTAKAHITQNTENNKDKQDEIDEGKRTFKEWLEDKKIYFETVLSVTLTFASILVSVFALIHGYQVAEDEAMLNLPLFNVSEHYINGPLSIGGITFPADVAVEYKIYNQGGELSNGQASGLRILTVSMCNGNYENVAKANFVVSDTFISAGTRYDPSEKTFTIYRTKNNVDTGKMVDQIEALLIQNYPYRFEIFWIDYAHVSYSDYRGDLHEVLIDLDTGTLTTNVNMLLDGYLPVIYSDDVESAYELIRTKLDSILHQSMNNVEN